VLWIFFFICRSRDTVSNTRNTKGKHMQIKKEEKNIYVNNKSMLLLSINSTQT